MSTSAEVLLRENPDRFVLFPIQYHDIWEFYKRSVASFWTVEEVDLTKDRDDWLKLTDNERHFIKNVLAFFAASDGIVLEHLSHRVMTEVQLPEARAFYACQEFMETIHSHMYSLMIDSFIRDPEERSRTFRAMYEVASIKKKADWALRWIGDDEASYAQRLLAFACIEGIFFSGSFCAIYWLKKRGVMPGLTMSNEFISRDEGLHTEFACLLYRNYITDKLSQEQAHQVVREALDIEKEFILESLPCALIGMNAESMSQYLEFVADRLLVLLGYEKLFLTANPFEWMNLISVASKPNFFEARVSQYQKCGVLASEDQRQVKFDEDF